MATPSIQTLITQAQQVLNLQSSNEIRATLAAVLANANVGTPLNPNLTTQQLWDEFDEIVRQSTDDIMSIIVDQMMRMVFSPPAPGGAGANNQVIFNDGGVLAGDAGLVYNKTTDALTVAGLVTAGSATITGDLTVDTSTLKVDSTNNRVIVGHTSGSAAFQVTNAGAAGLEIQPTGFSSSPLIQSYNRSGSAYTQLTLDASTIVHALSGTTAMTLNSTGLGVGVASPSNRLEAQEAGTGSGLGGIVSSTANTGGNAGYIFRTGGTNRWSVSLTGSAGAESIRFYDVNNAATRMTLDASGRLLVGPTSANTSGGILQLSSGVTFPATQVASSDANTLDDYEEGTFTPTISGSTAAGVGVYSNQIGRYTKIGNQVTVWIRISWSAHTGTGDMRISDLPFTIANVNNLGPSAAIGYSSNITLTAGNYLMLFGNPGTTRIDFWQTPTGGGSANTVSIDSSADIGITMTYFV